MEWPSKTTCHFDRTYKYYLGYNIQSSSFLESFSKWGDDGQERGTCNTRAEKKRSSMVIWDSRKSSLGENIILLSKQVSIANNFLISGRILCSLLSSVIVSCLNLCRSLWLLPRSLGSYVYIIDTIHLIIFTPLPATSCSSSQILLSSHFPSQSYV